MGRDPTCKYPQWGYTFKKKENKKKKEKKRERSLGYTDQSQTSKSANHEIMHSYISKDIVTKCALKWDPPHSSFNLSKTYTTFKTTSNFQIS